MKKSAAQKPGSPSESRFISPIIGLAWIAVVSGLLVMRAPSAARAAEGQAVPAP